MHHKPLVAREDVAKVVVRWQAKAWIRPCILLVHLDVFLTRLQQSNVYLSICGMIFCGIPTVSFISRFSNIIFASM